MRTSDFDYELPTELIAQHPAPQRDRSRLLVLHRDSGRIEHLRFGQLPTLLTRGDVLVLNNSRVIRARLRGRNTQTGGNFELLLFEESSTNDWWVLMRPGKRARVGTCVRLTGPDRSETGIRAVVVETNTEGHRRLRFEGTANIVEALEQIGEVPLPPYIERPDAAAWNDLDRERYQTVYAQVAGSVAAPTAGLHFTDELLDEVRGRGVRVCFVTLHVGLGTFAPVKSERIEHHLMHEERFELSEPAVRTIREAKRAGGRVVAVGTTTVRVLESVAAANDGTLAAGKSTTRMFIFPPCRFRIVNALVTNFHLPRSTLLMLVSAFAQPGETGGREFVLSAYREAVSEHYRFFSYGDAMLIL